MARSGSSSLCSRRLWFASALYWGIGSSNAEAQGQNQPEFVDDQGNATLRYDFRMFENVDGSDTAVPVGSVIASDPNGDELTYTLTAYDGSDDPPAPLFSISSDGEISYTAQLWTTKACFRKARTGSLSRTWT